MDKPLKQSVETNTQPMMGLAARLLYKTKRVLPFALLLLYISQFAAFIIANGGFEPYVRSTDFMPTLAAAQMIREGHGTSMFDFDVQHEVQARVLAPYKILADDKLLPINHLPFEALIILPFMSWPYEAVTLYWMILLAAALGGTFYLLQRMLPLHQPWLFIVVGCAISYQPVFRAFILGQTSPFVLLGVCVTYLAMRRTGMQWDMMAGIGLILISLKFQVLPMILLLVLMEGRWRALICFGMEMALLIIACMPILGRLWPLHYASLFLGTNKFSSTAAINPAIMHNWRGFAINTLGSLTVSGANILTILLTGLSLLLFVYAWWQTRQHNKNNQSNLPISSKFPPFRRPVILDMLWALGVVTAILISPHLNPHDLMLLIFPGWLMVYIVQNHRLPKKISIVWLRLLQIIYILTPVTFFIWGDSSLGVVINVLALAFSTWLFLQSIQAINSSPTDNRWGFDMATAKD